MILGMQLPSWKQIFQKNMARATKSFYENDNTFLLAESCMSINVILNSYYNTYKKERVTIWVPDYFCNQTIYSFREDWVDVIYYPITEKLDPDWNTIREYAKKAQIDIFLCVHYFGKYHTAINTAKEFCKLNNAILIEDCAHVLYPTGKMGQTGDFVIYSPHKQIPVKDAAVLHCNINKENELVFEEVKRIYNSLDTEGNSLKWYVKRCIQKVFPIHRRLTYYSGIHMGEYKKELHVPRKISKESYNVLCDYSYEELKRIAYIRRDNLQMMNYIMQSKYPGILPMLDESVDVPYIAVYSMKGLKNVEKVAEEIRDKGFTILYWPDLPYEIEGKEGHEIAFDMSRNIITFPIHQGIKPQDLINKFAVSLQRNGLAQVQADWDHVDMEVWNSIFSELDVTNIPQEWIYGNAKSLTEGWGLRRAIIQINNVPAGTIQVLEKRIAGIVAAVRVNRGPMLLPEFANTENYLKVMELVRKKYVHPIPIIYAPNIKMLAENLHLISNYGWKCIDCFGFPSALVDLKLTEEQLNRNLKPNWRKNLKKAREQVVIKNNDYNAEEIIRLYKEFLERKDIPGIPQHILKYLFSLEKPPLEVLTAHNEEGNMIAYKVLYTHGDTATSFIAWNTDEGLEKNARTLLIYSSMLQLKKLGFKYYDLGGVDDITTEAVAKYKRGMGGEDYRLLGEFIKF